jgi:HK97 family phage portal protein
LSLVTSLARGFHGFRADIGGAPAPWDDYWYGPVGAPSVAGMRISADSVKRLSTVLACVASKARSMGTMPCFIYQDMAGGGKKMLRKHPLFNLLHSKPNDMQTAFEYYQMLQGHIELRGNAYSEIDASSRGEIGQLIPMHPDRVRVEQLSNGSLRYVYNDPLTNSTRTLIQDEVLHVRDFADHRHVGQSRLAMGMDVFGVALAQQDYAGKFLKNDGTAGMFMTGLMFKGKAEEDAYIQKIEESSTGANRHRIRMMPPGVDIKSLGVKPIEMQLLEARKASSVEICSMFNVLPHKVGVDAGKAATYASVEQFNLMDMQQSLLPMAVMWEQALQRDVIQDDDIYAKFSLASFLRGDSATRTAGYAVAIEHGWLSPDDARELEDMNPIKGGIGKRYFRPLNWTWLEAPPQPAKSQSVSQDSSFEDDAANQDEAGSGGDQGSSSDQQSRMLSQLQILAHDNASRCVRREVSGVRKLIQHERNATHIAQFYAEHHRFLCIAFHFKSLQALKAKQGCDARSSELTRFMDEEDFAGATAWIEHVGATEVVHLAALAVEGVI